MDKYRAPYSILLFISGIMIMLAMLVGSHGHFNMENPWIRNSVLIFAVFLISGIVNIAQLVSDVKTKVLIMINITFNIIALFTLTQILVYIIDFNKYEGAIPMLFTILITALLLCCLCILLADIRNAIFKNNL